MCMMDARKEGVFSALPDELLTMILRSVSSDEDLNEVSLLSERIKRCANTARYQHTLCKQLQQLEKSVLWQYLDAIANDQNILDYLKEQQLLRTIPVGRVAVTLNEFCNLLKSTFSNRENIFSTDDGNILMPPYLREKANFILHEVTACHPKAVFIVSLAACGSKIGWIFW